MAQATALTVVNLWLILGHPRLSNEAEVNHIDRRRDLQYYATPTLDPRGI